MTKKSIANWALLVVNVQLEKRDGASVKMFKVCLTLLSCYTIMIVMSNW